MSDADDLAADELDQLAQSLAVDGSAGWLRTRDPSHQLERARG